MKNIRPKRRRLLFIPLAVIALVGAFLFLLPQLFQLPSVHKKTSASLARQIPGEVTYEKGALSLFPTPCIHFYDVHLTIDGRFSAAIDQVSVTPHFFSLLRGRFNISKLTLAGIDATAGLPEQAREISPAMILAVLRQQLDKWAGMLDSFKQKKFLLDIADGYLSLTRSGKPVFALQDMGGRLAWQRPGISLDMTSGSDLWNQSRLTLDTDIVTREISGRLTANNFKTEAGTDFLFAGTPFHLEDAALDADISWETDNFETWRFSVKALNPDINFSNDKTRFNLKGKRAIGEIQRDKTGLHASITELDLETPALRLAGNFELNTETPSAGWQVEVESLDVASTREAALFFAGRFKTARDIARILQEGSASQLTMGQEADTLAELKEVTTFHLQGRLDDAAVYVPKADLLLTESYGNVTVSGGILKAFDLETRLGNSTGSRGSFTVALTGGEPRPWSVVCDIQADITQLPPLLERLTQNTAFAREMAGIASAEGSVEGSLVLDHSPGGLQVTVEASKFELSAVYHRIPFPVTLSGGRFLYQGRGLRVHGVRGDIGDSHFSDLDASVTWETAPHLSISSARGDVEVNELAPWLGGTFTACQVAEDAPIDTGRLHVAHLQFEGPVSQPAAWRFQTDGYVSEIFDVCAPFFPEALTVYQGSFSATHDRIDIDGADLSVLGSRLSATGSLEAWLTQESPRILNASFEGSLGRNLSDWIYQRTGIPEILKWHTPISVTPLALCWHETDGVSITGEAAVPNGPGLSFSISKSADVLTVDNLNILDISAAATISMTRDKNGITTRFSGDLNRDMASAILADNQVLSGSLKGDVSARFDSSTPFFSSMTGRLRADGLDLAPIGLPLQITQALLTGNGASVDIDQARFTWKENPFSSSGQVARATEGILMDLNLVADRLDWPDIKALVYGDTATTPLLLGDIQFTCKHLGLTPELTFEPFEAHLKLDGNRTEIEFQQADACCISFPGTLTLMPDKMLFAFKPSATQQALKPTIACLGAGNAFMDGSFDLTGDIEFEWDRSGSIMETIEGSASLTAVDGRIYKGGFFGKLFSMLNVSEVLSGEFPDFEKEGFPYKTSTFEGKLKSGKFELETGVIDGPAMKLFFEGVEDFVSREHELTIVVAPLKTLDAVVDKIPVVNNVLEKGLVIYPVKVSGDWKEPELAVLSPTAVGDEVLGIMKRTLKAPAAILEKIFSGSKSEKEETPSQK